MPWDLALLARLQVRSGLESGGYEAEPELGAMAAGWQAAIGNVLAGSFATLQSLTMTGVLTAIGGGIIGGGLRFLSTCDWNLIRARLVQSYLWDHGLVFRTTLSTIGDLSRILRRLDTTTRHLPPDELCRILPLIDELNRLVSRITQTKRIHSLIQNLESAIARAAPDADVAQQLTELRVASDAFCAQETSAPSLPDEWDQCLLRADVQCNKLQQSLNEVLAKGAYDDDLYLRHRVQELENTSSTLLVMSLPDSQS